MNEIDKLAPEVREAMEVMDRLNTVTGSWNLLRAELTRLPDENAQLREQTKMPAVAWQQRAEQAEAELAALKAFAQDIMRAWPEGDVDGGELQDAALRHGLLREKSPRPTEPCGDACTCAEYYSDDDWHDGVTCYERTPLLVDE